MKRSWHGLVAAASVIAVSVVVAACSDGGPPAQPTNVTPVDAATAGTIVVDVVYRGAVPAPKEVSMSAVPACAALHSTPVYDQPIRVSNGHLADAVVYIKSGLGDRAFDFPTTAVQIDQRGCWYEPTVVALRVGQPLEFVNSDPEAHNVHASPKVAKGWNFMMSQRNARRTVYFTVPEVGVPVRCDVHPWMLAYVSAFSNPYFGISPAESPVTLAPVPPGQYVVGVWHRELGMKEQPVTVAPQTTASIQVTYDAP